jgi:CHAT domain-containing protein
LSVRRGDWVKRRNGEGVRGFITFTHGPSALVRWLGEGRGSWIGKRSIRLSSPPRALVLEGSLDSALHSPRSERDALQNWCDAAGIALAFKAVHRVEDFEQIVEALGRDRPPFVHIICHGNHDDNGRPYLLLAPRSKKRNRIYLDTAETHRAFHQSFGGQSVLFSACLVAKYERHIDNFRRSAHLKHVAAFSRTIYDDEAILFDISLYHSILSAGLTFPTAVARARDALATLGVRGGIGRGQKLVKVFG